MNCKKCHNNLIIYLEGGLTESMRRAMAVHLNECIVCSNYATFLSDALQVIKNEKEITPAPYLFTRIKARMETTHYRASQKIWHVTLQPAIFSILLLIGIYSGIKIGSLFSDISKPDYISETLAPAVNEMKAEPIELFLMD